MELAFIYFIFPHTNNCRIVVHIISFRVHPADIILNTSNAIWIRFPSLSLFLHKSTLLFAGDR